MYDILKIYQIWEIFMIIFLIFFFERIIFSLFIYYIVHVFQNLGKN